MIASTVERAAVAAVVTGHRVPLKDLIDAKDALRAVFMLRSDQHVSNELQRRVVRALVNITAHCALLTAPISAGVSS